MKHPTINQINGRLAANQTIQFYHSLNWYGNHPNRDNWRNKHFKFSRFGQEDRLTPAGNFIYAAALRQFQLIAGINTGYDYNRDNKSVFFELECYDHLLQFQVRVKRDMDGVRLEVNTNFKPIKVNDEYQTVFVVRSNKTFEEFDVKEYFINQVLPKYLYAPGVFRNIQIWKKCSKKEAIEIYKRLFKLRKPEPMTEYDREEMIIKAWIRMFKIKKNIELCDTWNNGQLLLIFNNFKYQKKHKKLFRHPSVFEMHEAYTREHDDDDHIEEFVNEIYDDYPKNSLFV
jgi:hypothetical protein